VLIGVLSLASAARAADRVYWANNTAGISFANLDGSGGGDLSTMGASLSNPDGLAIDPSTGKIYWANGGGGISFANLDGSGGGDLSTSGATVSSPEGVVVDPATGRIYWANGNGKISYANLNDTGGGGDLNTLGATPNAPEGVAIDEVHGRIYWGNVNSNTISFANLDNSGGGNLTITGTRPNVPVGLAIDPTGGKIYWANSGGGTGSIGFANLDGGGGGILNTSGATVNSPAGVAIDPTAGRVYWANVDVAISAPGISYANLNDTGGGGDLPATGATVSEPNFPALLETPSSASAPVIGGGSSTGTQMSCSQGSWGSDLLGAFLYRAPRSFAYQWTLNGADIAGATSSSFTASSPGSYGCSVTATNAAGSATQTSASHAVATPLGLTTVGQSHRRWREGNALPHVASATRPPIGTTFRFTVNESASVRFVFKQRGRKRGALSFSVGSGAHKLRFQGGISKHKRLKPGRYTLTITATNAAGRRASARLKFTIVR